MGEAIEHFVTYSIRYQILLARHIAGIYNMKIYVFDSNGFFDSSDDTEIEIVDNVRIVTKEDKRALLSVVVRESFGSNESLFLQYVDDNVLQKDDIGLYITPVPVETVDLKEDVKEISEKKDVDLKDISEAIEKIDVILQPFKP
jgi:nonstructural protein